MTQQKINKTVKVFLGFCKKVHKKQFYPFQKKLAEAMIASALTNSGDDWYGQISRQSGKTETVIYVVEFLMIFAPKILKRPFRIGIFAPQKEQTKTDFDRLKQALGESWRQGFKVLVDPKESNAITLQLPNGSFCYTFPLTETSHPESKTLDFVIYEEANKIKDKEKKDKSDPMRTSTNAPSFSFGVGGYQSNYFKRGIDKGQNVVKATYADVIKEKKQVFDETGDDFHLNYERFIRKILENTAPDDESFRTQYGLEFIVGGGSFITPEQLRALRGNFGQILTHEHETFAGLDTAKYPDRTILTVKCAQCRRILSWLRIQGDNYVDQFEIIKKRLSGYRNLVMLAIDSTGQGDFMPDMFDNGTDIDILRVKFSLQSKDAMAKNLLVQIRAVATQYPGDDSLEMREFEAEMLDLEREYKGEFLSVHHPDDPKAHDDYFDSFMLAEWAHRQFLENQPDIHIIDERGERALPGDDKHRSMGKKRRVLDEFELALDDDD